MCGNNMLSGNSFIGLWSNNNNNHNHNHNNNRIQAGGSDYFIAGVHDRNRALAGDTVVIQVLPCDKWLVSIWLYTWVYVFQQ